jgi:hypothetical protein
LKDLRWHGEEEMKRYDETKDQNTARVLAEVDGFVVESFTPGNATVEQVRRGLDYLMGRKYGDVVNNVAFMTRLRGKTALIVGVEVSRGSEAISEDAMSFRGYVNHGTRYALAGVANFEGSSDLHAQAFDRSAIGEEFQWMAWARDGVPSPPTVIVRMFGFDGDSIRTAWTSEPFLTPAVEHAVRITPGRGFTLSALLNHRETRGMLKRYVVTADGPQKVSETEMECLGCRQ